MNNYFVDHALDNDYVSITRIASACYILSLFYFDGGSVYYSRLSMDRKHSIKLSARSRCIMLVNRNVDKFSSGVRIFYFPHMYSYVLNLPVDSLLLHILSDMKDFQKYSNQYLFPATVQLRPFLIIFIFASVVPK